MIVAARKPLPAALLPLPAYGRRHVRLCRPAAVRLPGAGRDAGPPASPDREQGTRTRAGHRPGTIPGSVA